jgi:hypothetical protein
MSSCGPANYSSANAGNNGGAGIACDGSGGYEPVMNNYEGEHCGIDQCLIEHEQSHISDWEQRYGQCVGPRGSGVSTSGADYNGFLQQSECRAYNRELSCEERLFQNASPECRPYIQEHMEDTLAERNNSCQASYP